MRKSLLASVLLLALCCPALAGDMLCPPVAPPPPSAPQEVRADGDILNPPLVEFALMLFALI